MAWVNSASITCSTSNLVVWDSWISASTTTTCGSHVWTYWVGNSTSTTYHSNYVAPPPDPEAERRRREAYERQQQERAAARERARTLLLDHLTPEQAAEYEADKQFHVVSEHGRRYCIRHGRQHNIFEVDADGRRLKELCVHVREAVPDEDNLLAQKLALELCEDHLLATANVWDLTAGRVAA